MGMVIGIGIGIGISMGSWKAVVVPGIARGVKKGYCDCQGNYLRLLAETEKNITTIVNKLKRSTKSQNSIRIFTATYHYHIISSQVQCFNAYGPHPVPVAYPQLSPSLCRRNEAQAPTTTLRLGKRIKFLAVAEKSI